MAHFVDVAVDEGHGAEAGQAGASKPCKERRWAGAGKFWLRGRAAIVPGATTAGLDGGLGSYPTACSRAGTPFLPIPDHCTHTEVYFLCTREV